MMNPGFAIFTLSGTMKQYMTHLPHLIQDLGLILIAAAMVTILFKMLKQPVVLGYLIAGFLVGPNFAFFPSIHDQQSISIWAEIGVIFMLFGLGLEFSFKKLVSVGKSASITASIEIIFMLGLGYWAGQILGWSKMDSLFMGGILSISSTTIIVRAFEELGLKGRNFVSLVFGVLIVEDLLAILLMVLLSSVAVTQSLSGTDLAYSSLRLAFFLVLWFLLGIYLLPILLRKFKRFLSDETMLIVSIGLCLLMVIVASLVGFSPALGAFVMGSILAETPKGHQIEKLILPVKDLFSAVFFVSVGMMIDFQVLQDYFGVILLMSTLTVVGKMFSSSMGAIASGRSLKNSVQAGMSLAQIGEFSFIIATLGMTLKVTSDFLYPIAVAVSAVTTFVTPYLIRSSDPFYAWLEKRIPSGLKSALYRYEQAMMTQSAEGWLTLIWKGYGLKIVLNAVLVIGVTLAGKWMILPVLNGLPAGTAISNSTDIPNLISFFVTLVVCTPFLWAIFSADPARTGLNAVESARQLKRLQIGVSILRFFVGGLLVGFLIGHFTSVRTVAGVLMIGFAVAWVMLISRFTKSLYLSIEKRFISNLTEKERFELAQKASTPELAPWSATLAQFVVSPSSPLIAKRLMDSGMKEKFGVTVAMIERGHARILAPTKTDMLLPFDTVYLIGTDEQLASARLEIETDLGEPGAGVADSFGLTSLVVLPSDSFVNKPIRECGLREAVNGLIVGLERQSERILSPDSAMMLLPGDLIWIVGDRSLIRGLRP